MKLWILLLAAAGLWAGPVPGQFIVYVDGEPAAVTLARAVTPAPRVALAADELIARRAAVRSLQQPVRQRIESRGGRVLTSLDTVLNALVVSGLTEAELAAFPGVQRVEPVVEVRAHLDAALGVHRVSQAMATLPGGAASAGAGVKIGIVDSGLDVTHPGFQDETLSPAAGFPKADTPANRALTNRKVIAARSYESLLGGNPAATIDDRYGHGTAVAMAAAGVRHSSPRGEISGVAPKAYLGVYRVTQGSGLSSTTAALAKALDDAVADGMEVINLSFGSAIYSAGTQADSIAVENASRAGVVVAVSAGNEGPDFSTLSTPANTLSALAVAAQNNARSIRTVVTTSAGGQFDALPAPTTDPGRRISGRLVDAGDVDSTRLACTALPSGSLTGRVALILRGGCNFSVKLENARAAGAVAALVYNNVLAAALISMTTDNATLPAMFISNENGLALRDQLRSGVTGVAGVPARGPANPSAQPSRLPPAAAVLTASLDFVGISVPQDPTTVTGFSSRGPDPLGAIKPDLTAVGAQFFTATQRADPNGGMYSQTRYIVTQGTSFSAPLVAGAAAVLRGARPGLSAADYRSLLVNSSQPLPGGPSAVGAGSLDLEAALKNTIVAAPLALNFGSSGSILTPNSRILTLRNTGTAAETLTLTVEPQAGGLQPGLSVSSVTLGAGEARQITVTFGSGTANPAEYAGFVRIGGARSGVATRVPYRLMVPSTAAQSISVIFVDLPAANALQRPFVSIRVTDAAGNPVDVPTPVATVDGGATVIAVVPSGSVPGTFDVDVRWGAAGLYRLTVRSGNATRTFSVLVP